CVEPANLIPIAIGYAVALACWFGLRKQIGHIGFYALFALVVTQSVQLVGIYLVFASLIVPALASRRFAPSSRLLVGYGVGILGYVIGLIVSAMTDLPTGATIVVALVSVFAATLLVPASKAAEAA
ncbi:MAG: metal ABC transporter permease, partial [Pseudomonadota bacterium]